MNTVLISNRNKKVSPDDEVCISGDFTMKSAAYASKVLSRLKWRKYLIKGNHDQFADKAGFDKSAFEWIRIYHELDYQKQSFILFHCHIEVRNGY